VSAAQHTPGPAASLEITLRIGQRVRHHDFHGKRVTGIVRGLSVDGEDVLHADIALDDAIVIPPINSGDHELRIYRQHVPAHEVCPFDDRDELIGDMLGLLRRMEEQYDDNPSVGLSLFIDDIRRAIAKATGSAS
jgi:hypothetical protein